MGDFASCIREHSITEMMNDHLGFELDHRTSPRRYSLDHGGTTPVMRA